MTPWLPDALFINGELWWDVGALHTLLSEDRGSAYEVGATR